MAESSRAILQHYSKLTEYLGLVLGPDYEIVLHDLTDANRSIIAIVNGHISGREVGAPLTNMALSILRDRSYERADWRVHDYGVAENGKHLRSNTFFIKEDGRLIGMLCINFDDSRYRAAAEQILSLCHPDGFALPDFISGAAAGAFPGLSTPERFSNSSEAVVTDAVRRELEQLGVSADRLTPEERMHIIATLEAGGIFLIKGAVRDAAAALGCSQASVYRYLSQQKSASGEG